MRILFFLFCVFSMVTYLPIAEATVILSADASRIALPGGYVVPEGSNVTFICNSSSGRDLFWRINVTNDMRIRTDTVSLKEFRGFSSPDESEDANPASFTFHNISLENNPSPVECSDPSVQDESKARAMLMIVVEGPPQCPSVHTIATFTSFMVTVMKSQIMWLTESYHVVITTYDGLTEYSSLTDGAPFNVTSLEPGTVYNISVIPCNMAGCNESCGIYSVLTMTKGTRGPDVHSEPDNASRPDLGITFTLVSVSTVLLIAMVTTTMIIIVCACQRRERLKKSGGGERRYEDIVAGNSPDCLATLSSQQDSNTVDAVHVSFQVHNHDAILDTAAKYEEIGWEHDQQ